MFESTLLTALTEHTALTAYLSTYTDSEGTHPSIFANSAPEKSEFMYLVFKIDNIVNEFDDSVVDVFDVTLDIFGYGKSGVNERAAIREIENLLDRNHLSDSNLDTIRF